MMRGGLEHLIETSATIVSCDQVVYQENLLVKVHMNTTMLTECIKP